MAYDHKEMLTQVLLVEKDGLVEAAEELVSGLASFSISS